MALLPPFTDDGLLPAGDFTLNIDQLLISTLVRGPRKRGEWDVKWRRTLAKNLAVMVGHLRQIGVNEIFVDGSFVENKTHPNDIDGYFICDRTFFYDGSLEARLQQIDPVWTWDPKRRYASPETAKRQLPMWHKYRVELFPHVGQFTGIRDSFGQEMTFPSAFRLSRSGQQKGIVKIGGLS